MLTPLFTLTLALTVATLLFFASFFLASRSRLDREKSSPFECGFDPLTSARVPFSLRFFLLAVIFLVFDIEIVLLFPFVPAMKLTQLSSSLFICLVFIFILISGLLHEWYQGSLSWSD